MKIKATIIYRIKKTHPDKAYIKDWRPNKVYRFTDTYNIEPGSFWSLDDMRAYIKRDLRLVAGGGYNSDHIYKVSFNFS